MMKLSKELRVFPTIWDRITLRVIFLLERLLEKDTEWLLRVLKYLGYNHAFAIKILQYRGLSFSNAENIVFNSETWKMESEDLKRSTELIRYMIRNDR